MERETGFEPATSSLGKWAAIGQNVSDNNSNGHRRNQMKEHDKKCTRSKQRAKLPVPTKEVRKAPEKAATAAEVQ
jgi:hypothetical protein